LTRPFAPTPEWESIGKDFSQMLPQKRVRKKTFCEPMQMLAFRTLDKRWLLFSAACQKYRLARRRLADMGGSFDRAG